MSVVRSVRFGRATAVTGDVGGMFALDEDDDDDDSDSIIGG